MIPFEGLRTGWHLRPSNKLDQEGKFLGFAAIPLNNLYFSSSNAIRFADIWSIGCTVIEMATAKPPWADKNPIQAMFYIANAVEPPPIPDGLSPECKDFISKCLR